VRSPSGAQVRSNGLDQTQESTKAFFPIDVAIELLKQISKVVRTPAEQFGPLGQPMTPAVRSEISTVSANAVDEPQYFPYSVTYPCPSGGAELGIFVDMIDEQLAREFAPGRYGSIEEVVPNCISNLWCEMQDRPPSKRILSIHDQPRDRDESAILSFGEKFADLTRIDDLHSTLEQAIDNWVRPSVVEVRPEHHSDVLGIHALFVY
jgi:hypothetical protein